MHRQARPGAALAAALLSVSLAASAAPAAGPRTASAQPPARSPAPEERLVLAVSEGTSGGATPGEIIEKYRPLAEVIGRAVHMNVIIEPARNFQRLDEGMRERRYDLAMARPSDYPARAVRDYGYRYVANAKPDGHCVFLVSKDSPARSLADLRGQRIVLPEKVSYMAQFCSAELRDAGFDLSQRVQYVKEQEVVVYWTQTLNAELGGVASYSKALKQKEGLRELARSRPQPYMPLVAGPRLSQAQIEAIRAELVKLKDTPAGQQLVARLGITGFDDGGEKRLNELLAWLEKK